MADQDNGTARTLREKRRDVCGVSRHSVQEVRASEDSPLEVRFVSPSHERHMTTVSRPRCLDISDRGTSRQRRRRSSIFQPEGTADVQSWVRAERADLDAALHDAGAAWLDNAWPFTAIRYAPR
jgi:hypothetical protein